MARRRTGSRIGDLKRRVLRQLVQEVPADIALCEFDCRKRQCRRGEWATCRRRLDHLAGEPPAETGRAASA